MKKYILQVIVFVFLMSACGAASPELIMTDREMAEQTIRDFYTAIEDGKYDEAYQLLSSEHRNSNIDQSFLSNLQYHLVSIKIVTLEPFEGAVETERCMRFHVVIEQTVKRGSMDMQMPAETQMPMDSEMPMETMQPMGSQLTEEEWVAVVKEGDEWKLEPNYYGLGKDSFSKFK